MCVCSPFLSVCVPLDILVQRISTNEAGGASSSFSLAPTKTLNVAGDIRANHPDVPVFEMARG